jgi:membrane-bound lytic murein transglycosylase F
MYKIWQNVCMAILVYRLLILIVCLSVVQFTGCSRGEPLAKPWREELTIIVERDIDSPEAEFRQQLINLFVKKVQVPVRLLPLTADEVAPALISNRAHVSAAEMRINNTGDLRFAPSYQSVRERVVCLDPPKHINDLVGKGIAVIAGSAQDDALREAQQKIPLLNWEARKNQTTTMLLDEVVSGKLDCTIANDVQFALAQNFHPLLQVAFEIASPSKHAWAIAPAGDDALFAEVKNFFEEIRRNGTLRRMLDRYFGHFERLEPVDAVAFLSSTGEVLPYFRQYFEEASALTGLDWQLLAAIGYHESHWNPLATSFTGVRGIMMLTEETADRMDVTNRLDPRQSILAGARYLQLLKDQLPSRIANEERTWLALAAYNQGMGHLEDARALTARNGLNADSWSDVKKMMPLLAQPEYFEQTKHGYARGGEAVVLVETVHLYLDMLKHMNTHDIPNKPSTPFHLKLPGAKKFSLP